ncbi:MAG: 3-dehydroquinate dehydratase [Candidatus Jacksonbacteria bacterium]|nr:3-dehydroquinate dehydratase [Candidatus Jacksonbacteria bacterium]
MVILVINGPNLNFLGKRDKKQYGEKTLDDIAQILQTALQARFPAARLEFFHSNHEGAIIDYIQKNSRANALIINPGALSHYSYALADALRDFPGVKAEVHLSSIEKREAFRRVSVTASACGKMIAGKKWKSYVEALEWIIDKIK